MEVGWNTHPTPQRPRKTTSEGLKKRTLHIECITPLPGQCSTAQRGLPWAASSSNGKREQEGIISSSSICGLLFRNPYSSLPPWGFQENLGGLNPQQSDSKGKETFNNQYSDLGRPSSYIQYLSSNPNRRFCSSTEPSQAALWPGKSVGCRSAWFRSSNEFCWPWSLVFPCQGKELNHSPTHCGECFLTPNEQKSW